MKTDDILLILFALAGIALGVQHLVSP